MDKNTLLTITAFIYFSMSVAHIARVVFGGEMIFFGISLPYIVSILIGIGISYLGWKSLSFRD
tara:strand:- start:472 stop:660 length:189 start_codon:yes stop_codon:yes gene_type:complete